MTKEGKSEETTKKESSYSFKVWQTAAILFLFITIVLIVRIAFSVMLMGLAGVLIAIYFHGLADIIQMKTKLGRNWAMLISTVGTVIIICFLLWFIGGKVQTQITELANTLPKTVRTVKDKLAETPLGKKILDYSSGNNSQKLVDTAEAFFNTTFGVLGDLYIILFLGLFFTADPSTYKNGILALVPKDRKHQYQNIMNRISSSLKGWLKGMVISMILITFMITIGLTIIGIPATIVLGLITGILVIVPNFGPLIAMIPGVLLAFTVSTNTAVVVALLYIISQTIVSSIVTPLLQKRIINLPPVLTLMSQLIMGTLSGVLGIILAVPLLAILIILIDELYLKANKANIPAPVQ